MDFRSLTFLAAAGLASAYAVVLVPSRAPFSPAQHPVAVLAWVKASCWHEVELKPNAARATTEDVLVTAAAMEETARRSGRKQACQEALAIADEVVAKATRPHGEELVRLSRLHR